MRREVKKWLSLQSQIDAMRTARRVPFYRRTKVEKLGEKHPGLVDFVYSSQNRRVPNTEIAAAILAQWGEIVSGQALSNFWQLRTWPRQCEERRGA